MSISDPVVETFESTPNIFSVRVGATADTIKCIVSLQLVVFAAALKVPVESPQDLSCGIDVSPAVDEP
jgi:hypothetical protein